jgi:hypothetical protein
MTDIIYNIPVDAPLFNKATAAELFHIIKKLSNASYYYADDSGRDWGQASLEKMQAAATINRLALPFEAIEALYRHQPQLLDFAALMNAVLKDARK